MASTTPLFSIIICLYKVQEQFFSDLKKFDVLKYPKYEIIIVTEKSTNLTKRKLPYKIVKATKENVSLGEKRDIGMRAARGEFCAFIDDDAYPFADWLTNAYKDFKLNSKVAAVGGPNITPSEDSYWAKIGGYIYESYFTSGGAQFRFIPKHKRYIDELQGVNLIIRSNILRKLGGFRSKLSSGDDSKVCSDIRKLGYKVLYDPKVKVYHHRRIFPGPHLRQIRNMGTHRGFFVKAFPHTLSAIYFLPSLLMLSFVIGFVLSIIFTSMRLPFLFLLCLFFLIPFLTTLRKMSPDKAMYVTIGIILTHIVYGLSFLKGLTLSSIEKE